ncbi:TOMM precursor leader peptide-binding protein [Cohnella pontilimi]|uniref:TOMM leader peptide-binding protein n=1 Tax=Cohnella pontilimi TaxID=2564100 RepID=A0A4U0FAF5_9BACL|nr:TOMM precursor leader peptide-binding protein [Cohnella pontilimi]TJY41124.1 TOMM precursor leader peptide-binding protein [Cohnella pontilimi]
MSAVIAVIGTGRLAEMVIRQLSETYKVVCNRDFRSEIPASASLCLVMSDEFRPSDHQAAAEVLYKTNKPWLVGFVASSEGAAGPLVRPGITGCSLCAQNRQMEAESGREESIIRLMALWKDGVIRLDPTISDAAIWQLGCFIRDEVRLFLQGKTARTEKRIYLLDLHSFTGSLHRFLPDPACPVCGSLSEDSPDSARITLLPRAKMHKDAYRSKSSDELAETLIEAYEDERTGLLHTKTKDSQSPFCDVLVTLPSGTGNEITAGRSHSYKKSGDTAILEGLERYCGMMPRGKRIVVKSSYREVRQQALHLVSAGLYSEEQYASPDFPFEKFDEEAVIPWVWGQSLTEDRPILVPQELAYYGTVSGARFVMEGSNGCAVGGNMEEAILHGLLEVVERDAFLLAWYARMPIPRLEPDTAQDTELMLMIERVRAVSGFDVALFNATTENRIPSIWAVAKNRKNTGANLICAAGAHLDPVRAAKSAIFELAGHAAYLDDMYNTRGEEFSRMLNEPELVAEMPDHACLYTVPGAEARFDFLFESGREARSFTEEFKWMPTHSDLTEDLKSVLQQFRKLGLDIIVVDQTAPELSHLGLRCVKVIIPGMLPMSFGHPFQRLTGLDRWRKVPVELGYATRELTEEDLNPHPHPFL